jgi:hypothetical protein
MNILLYSRAAFDTGRRLSSNLSFKGVYALRKKSFPPHRCDVLFRYGDSTEYNDDDFNVVINSAEAVKNAADKDKMREILSSAERVNVPESIPEGYTGFRYARTRNGKVEYRDYATRNDKVSTMPIDKLSEFRVHVFRDSIMGVYQKVPLSGVPALYNQDTCTFRRIPQPEVPRGVMAMCKRAVAAIGLDFAGVDVVLSTDNNIYVLEVNSSPGLSDTNIDRLKSLLNEQANISF